MLENLDVQKQYKAQPLGTAAGGFGMNVTQTTGMTPMGADINLNTINQPINTINEAAADSFIGQRVSSFAEIDPLLQYGVTIPAWFVINQAMDRYLKFCKGDYNTTILAKYGNFGDKVSHILFDNPVGRVFNKAANAGKSLFNKVIYNNSAVVRALFTTPSQPELAMVKSQTGGFKTMLTHDIVNVWEEFAKPLNSAKDLDSLGLKPNEVKQIEERIAKIVGEENKKIALQAEEFKILNRGASAKDIQAFKNMNEAGRLSLLKELKIKRLGFKDLQEFELIKSAPEKYMPKILDLLKNSGNELFARIGFSDKNIGTKVKGAITGRKVYLSELYNKLYGAMGGNHKTVLGRSLVKLSNNILEGATNRMQGGKFAVLLHAYFLAEVLIRAARQESASDKAKSFIERYAELIGFFVFIPPSLKIMHALGGMQYSGMTPEQVEAYRKAKLNYNEHIMNCDWTKEVAKQNKKAIQAMRPKTYNPLVWACRKVGDIITVGLEQFRPYTKHKVQKVDLTISNIMKNPKQYFKDIPKRLVDFFHNPKYWLKQMAGYPMRFGLPMIVILPFFNKYLVKGVNAIFGKPKEGLADESKYEEQKEQAEALAAQQGEQPQLTEAQMAMLANALAAQKAQQQVSPTASVQQIQAPNNKNGQISHTGNPFKNEQVSTSSNNNSVVAAEKKDDKKTQVVDTHQYIPSSDPVVIVNQDKMDDATEKALKRLAYFEKDAIKKLS